MDNYSPIEDEKNNQSPLYARLIDRIDELEKKITSLNEEYMNSVRSTQVGLNNVFDEFKKISNGSLISHTANKLNKMQSDFYDLKRQMINDISFVKKCYKIMPTISKIREFDDDDYQKLIKILELI